MTAITEDEIRGEIDSLCRRVRALRTGPGHISAAAVDDLAGLAGHAAGRAVRWPETAVRLERLAAEARDLAAELRGPTRHLHAV